MAFKRMTCEQFLKLLRGGRKPSENDKHRAAEHANGCDSCRFILEATGLPENWKWKKPNRQEEHR